MTPQDSLKENTLSCDPKGSRFNPSTRFMLKWFAEAVVGVPVRSTLKEGVRAIRFERELEGLRMTFLVETAIQQASLMRRHKELLAAAQAGFLAQSPEREHICALGVEVDG